LQVQATICPVVFMQFIVMNDDMKRDVQLRPSYTARNHATGDYMKIKAWFKKSNFSNSF